MLLLDWSKFKSPQALPGHAAVRASRRMSCRALTGDGTPVSIKNLDLFQRLAFLLVVVFLTGCSGLMRRAPAPGEAVALAEAGSVLATLGRQNDTLQSFKGLGRIKMWRSGQAGIDERIAWVGAQTNKLRIVLLVSGYPAIKMASDGNWFYYYEAGSDPPLYKKIPANDPSLKTAISIRINASEIIHLLAGRVPLSEHHTAELTREDSGEGYVLEMKRWWGGICEKIFLDESKSRVRQVEFYSRSGTLEYRARFIEMQTVNGYQVPAKLSISNDDGAGLLLDIERYWADVPVSPSMFVLDPPGAK